MATTLGAGTDHCWGRPDIPRELREIFESFGNALTLSSTWSRSSSQVQAASDCLPSSLVLLRCSSRTERTLGAKSSDKNKFCTSIIHMSIVQCAPEVKKITKFSQTKTILTTNLTS